MIKGKNIPTKYLGNSFAFLSLPAWAKSVPTNSDVIVVGTGSAGLAAAKKLIAAGKSVLVLGASSVIGGRALTNKPRVIENRRKFLLYSSYIR